MKAKDITGVKCNFGGSKNAMTHGMSNTHLYRTWRLMKQKCSNKNASGYPIYGGRGITVCEEWLSFEPFQEWALANGYKENLSIDRINDDGNFEPSNCQWVNLKEQGLGTRRGGVLLTYKGESHTLKEWSKIKNIDYTTLRTRFKKGLDVDLILFSGKLPRWAGVCDEETTQCLY